MGRRKTKESHNGTGHVCGECRHGDWADYLDYLGHKFFIYCPFSTYAQSPKMNIGVCMDNTRACDKFKEGKKANQ